MQTITQIPIHDKDIISNVRKFEISIHFLSSDTGTNTLTLLVVHGHSSIHISSFLTR